MVVLIESVRGRPNVSAPPSRAGQPLFVIAWRLHFAALCRTSQAHSPQRRVSV